MVSRSSGITQVRPSYKDMEEHLEIRQHTISPVRPLVASIGGDGSTQTGSIMALRSKQGSLAILLSTAVAFTLTVRSRLLLPTSLAFFFGAFCTVYPVSVCIAYLLNAQALAVPEFVLA